MPIQNAHISNQHTEHTVKDFLKNYTLIQDVLTVKAQNEFISESLFTGGYNADGGGIQFAQSQAGSSAERVPQYMQESYENGQDFSINEGSEFHRVHMTEVTPQRAYVRKYGIEGEITYEEERRNQLGALARMTTRMKNTMVKHLDGIAMNMLVTSALIRNSAAAAVWGPTATTIFDDLMIAASMVENEDTAGGTFNANTLVLNPADYLKLKRNRDVKDVFGEPAPRNQSTSYRPQYVDTLEDIAGLTIMRTRALAAGTALVLERGAIGGIADEVPLYMQPPERINKREVIEIRAGRTTTAFLTDPGAIVRVTGI